MTARPRASGELVPLGDLLPRAEIPNWNEWQKLCAEAARSRYEPALRARRKAEILKRPERQMKLFD